MLSTKGDSVVTYHNNLRYLFITNALDKEDFFVKNEQEYFSKGDLKVMLSKGEINNVDRNYQDDTGFNRLK